MAEGYQPTDGMKSAARRALQWKKEGKRGGTRVGLARANQIVNGVSLSESTVMRMYSFFSRHEVDKKATGFSSGEEGFPSPGRVAWDLWGGDAGYSWSRQKAESIKNKREMRKMSSIWDGAFLGQLGKENSAVAENIEVEEIDAPLELDVEPAIGNNVAPVQETAVTETVVTPAPVVDNTPVVDTPTQPVETTTPVTQEVTETAPAQEEPKVEAQDAAPATENVATSETVAEQTTEQPTA